ncbi:MAG: UvrD-helicase domain-containing protein [Acidobacteriota bacterium]
MSELNDRQMSAAYESGSVAITAGAGTGKTHVLAERYFHLLTANKGWGPLNIVAVTFTDKAADELRSRIRDTVSKKGAAPVTAAEIEAAQISTIHALAARICRDFYDIAEIPADFRLMDENESALWTLGKIEEAIGSVCEAEARGLGYSFLLSALSQLMSDPYAAEKAFETCDEALWRQAISEAVESHRGQFCDELRSGECVARLRDICGADGDNRELRRLEALAAVDLILDGDLVGVDSILAINLRGGSAAKWPEGCFAEAKDLITALRKLCTDAKKRFDIAYGELDDELLARVTLLRSAFGNARDFLAQAKLREKYLDYNDLELYALKILQNSDAAAHYSERWKAFLIDEFQDVNPIQAELLGRLTANANLTIVGDEKQSIYGFRGADVDVFGKFKNRIAEAGGKPVVLEETYRSNSSLVKQMNVLFEPLLGSMHQSLDSKRDYIGSDMPEPIRLAIIESDEDDKPRKQNVEARHIARVVRQMVDDKVPVYDKSTKSYRPAGFGDFAVLSRVWEPLEIYGDAFAEAGVPAVNAGGGSLIKTREFKDAYALLTFLADQLDDLSLVAVLRSPFFAVSDRELYKFALTMEKNTPWWPNLKESQDLDAHLASARDLLNELLRERVHHSPEGLLRHAARRTGYAAVAANLPHGSRREADWNGTLQFIRGLQQKGWEDLFSVARYLRLAVRSKLDINRPTLESGDAVALMTVHAAKGLEWPVVFVPDLTRKFQNDTRTLAVDTHLGVAFGWEDADGEKTEPAIYKVIRQRCRDREDAERRRLLYVAVTRAGDFVHLSSTGGKGSSLDLLMSGLNAAGVAAEMIVGEPKDMLTPAPGEPAQFPDLLPDIDPVNVATESVMATGISTYASCPRKYKFQFVDGHPGLGEGTASAAAIGTLAHLALELGIDSAPLLRLHGGCGDDELVEKALEQARNFRENSAFAGVRELAAEKELRFSTRIGDIGVFGIADLVGEDFVLDYKTDSVADPDKHKLQLWAYARALGKQKAYIAYLRHNILHEITPADLSDLDGVGLRLIARLRSGDFAPSASEPTCRRCTYTSICSSAHDGADSENIV